MYCVFSKYYPHFEDEYSYFSDYNILTLVSGVQIIRYRKYYIDKYGKDEFLKKYKNFDVFYKEYIYSGIILFIIVFLVNFFLIIYMIRTYQSYKLENEENYSLILSGKIEQNKLERDITNPNYTENNTLSKTKTREIIEKYKKIDDKNFEEEKRQSIEKEKKDLIIKELSINDVDINFTFELSEYYETINEINSLEKEIDFLNYRITKNKCCCCCLCCCCFCGKCFGCCCCNCCNKDKTTNRKIKAREDRRKLKQKLEKMNLKNNEYNPLYILTLKNKKDYETIYNKYPHNSLLIVLVICAKKIKIKIIFIYIKLLNLKILFEKI